ncbi:hypothetical protein FC756_14095 [Lysinibacillus mangiferihumi]|uniref:Permease n=1 Tax=Lysinibacillus mangiferihumi TaxID=1130819 RepID=A0A4U2Z0V3_9BACI|nr:hypothetical protein [Lysinibacillus mangiferihumi]TKI66862.1 hypothetical protein FC756_14095 [Lysinibacillus mangiferihumi]
MFNRKLLAAFVTSIICYFIVPFFFNDFTNSYFAIGLGVSIISVPILFTIGILASIVIEFRTKHILFSYMKHFGCGLICVCVLLLLTEWNIELFFIYTGMAFVYVTVFFISDHMIKSKFVN